MSLYSSIKSTVVGTSSYLASVAGSIMAPSYTPAIVSPIARCAFRYSYGAPTTWMAMATERFAVSAAVSTALPYAPAVGACLGGASGMAVSAGAFYIGEQVAGAAVNSYRQRCNRNAWRALGNQNLALSEGVDVEEGQWVDLVNNNQLNNDGIAV